MSGGGGQNTVVQNSAPPPEFMAAYRNVVGQAQNVAQTPYQAYPGKMVADFSPDQRAGMATIQNAQGIAAPYINTAADYIGNSTRELAPQFTPYSDAALSLYDRAASLPIQESMAPWHTAANDYYHQGGNGISAGDLVQYTNPWTQQVVQATQNQFNNQNAIQQQGIVGNAVSNGAFGGDRQAVAQAVLAGQQQANQAPVIAGLESQGFQTALAAAQAQRQRELAAGQGMAGLSAQQLEAMKAKGQLTLGAGQGRAGIAQQQLSAAEAQAWLNSQAGFGMANLGREAQGTTMQDAQALMGIGGMQQQQAQQNLNIPYQQFTAAQAYPFQTVGWLGGISSGIGSAAGGRGSTSYPGASPLSQVAGAGLTGLGLYNGLNQAGLFGGAAGAGMDAVTAAHAAGTTDAAALAAAEAAGVSYAAPAAADAAALAALYKRGGAVQQRADGGRMVTVGDNGVPHITPSPKGGGLAAADDYLAGQSAGAYRGLPAIMPTYSPSADLNWSSMPSLAAPGANLTPDQRRALEGFQWGGIDSHGGGDGVGTFAGAAELAGLALLRHGGKVPGRASGGPTVTVNHGVPHLDYAPMSGGLGAMDDYFAGQSAQAYRGLPIGPPPVAPPPPAPTLDANGLTPAQENALAQFNWSGLGSNGNMRRGGGIAVRRDDGGYVPLVSPTDMQTFDIPEGGYRRLPEPEAPSPNARGRLPVWRGLPGQMAPIEPLRMNLAGADQPGWREEVEPPGAGIAPSASEAEPTAEPEPPPHQQTIPEGAGIIPASTRRTTMPTGAGIAPPSLIPEPQMPSRQAVAAAPTQAGATQQDGIAPWEALTMAGLGMMAGTSPNAMTNIGRGGIEGLKFYEAQKVRREQAELRRLQQQELNQYRSERNEIYGKRVEDLGTHQQNQDTTAAGKASAQTEHWGNQDQNAKSRLDFGLADAIQKHTEKAKELQLRARQLGVSEQTLEWHRQAMENAKSAAQQNQIKAANAEQMRAATAMINSGMAPEKAYEQAMKGYGTISESTKPATVAPKDGKPALTDILGE